MQHPREILLLGCFLARQLGQPTSGRSSSTDEALLTVSVYFSNSLLVLVVRPDSKSPISLTSATSHCTRSNYVRQHDLLANLPCLQH